MGKIGEWIFKVLAIAVVGVWYGAIAATVLLLIYLLAKSLWG